MFDVNLKNQSGLQNNTVNLSHSIGKSEISSKVDKNDRIIQKQSNFESIHSFFFLLIMFVFITLMVGLIYLRGEMSFINNLINYIITSISQFF